MARRRRGRGLRRCQRRCGGLRLRLGGVGGGLRGGRAQGGEVGGGRAGADAACCPTCPEHTAGESGRTRPGAGEHHRSVNSPGDLAGRPRRHPHRLRRRPVPLHRRARARDRAALAGRVGGARHVLRRQPGRATSRTATGATRTRPAGVLRAWTCSRTPRARACTSATRWATSPPTSSAASAACRATTCCTRWRSTRSACPPSSTRCRRASTRAPPPRRTSPIMQRQLRRLGLAHDARRSFATIDPGYVRWTQWIFLQIFDSWYDETAPRPTAASAGRARSPSWSREYDVRASRGARVGDLDDVARRRVLDTHRLAYVSETPVNWCPGLGTVLANEEVTADGRSERGNFPVFQRSLRQWNMRITAYADRLIDDLERIDWPEKVKAMQRNWIGRSSGARVRFAVQGGDQVEVFTTRPDTLFGATFIVVAPEHPLLDEVPDRVARRHRGRLDRRPPHAGRRRRVLPRRGRRQDRGRASGRRRPKTGVFTGHLAANPVNGELLPVFTADYVLMGYGTGAIMAVPGGDERDFEFAAGLRPAGRLHDRRPRGHRARRAHRRRRRDQLVERRGQPGRPGRRRREGRDHRLARRAKGVGEGTITYRLRDWLFSRQRYWGEPFPIVYDEHDLPMRCPGVDAAGRPARGARTTRRAPSTPTTRTPRPSRRWAATRTGSTSRSTWATARSTTAATPTPCPTGPAPAGTTCATWTRTTTRRWSTRRSSSTGWARATASRSRGSIGGVDLYVGGVEHAVLHLLYARFWHKVLYDLGHVSSGEPFHKLFNQGYIQAYAYTDAARRLRARRRGRRGRRGRDRLHLAGRARQPRVREDGQVAEEHRDARRHVRGVRRRHPARLRDVDGPARPVAPVGDPRRRRLAALPAAAVAQRRRRGDRRASCHGRARRPTRPCASLHRTIAGRDGGHGGACGSTPRSPSSSC